MLFSPGAAHVVPYYVSPVAAEFLDGILEADLFCQNQTPKQEQGS